jgi:sec-independent protein translocase protein TatB
MNIGWTEFLVIAMIGLIVFGPERLPEMAGQFAKFIKTMRAKASEATAELTKSVDTKVVTDLAKDLRGLTPRGLATNAVTSVAGLTGLSGQPKPSTAGSAKVNPVFDPDAT